MQDVIIIGAGPAGMAAAVTAKKLKLNVLVVAKEIKNLDTYPNSDFLNTQSLFSLFVGLLSS